MDMPPEMHQLAASLTAAAARSSAQLVSDKVRSLRAGKKTDETIAGLEEIISELIDDKAELTRIAQAFQAELVAQTLTAGDVRYIADTVVPMLEKVADAQGASGTAFKKSISDLKPLLSAETVTVLQLLGFNFRRGVGDPLTKLTEKAILSRVSRSDELQLAQVERENLYMQIALDPDAHARFERMMGR
ncbi:hypothetical protein ACFQ0P_07420 [Microbacterium insulae]|uniref:DUF222 domain-containing protein n=1 Tax=Microbacterium insulae TaxID=483014 RepID=A0ABW3AHH8_9MICO